MDVIIRDWTIDGSRVGDIEGTIVGVKSVFGKAAYVVDLGNWGTMTFAATDHRLEKV